jgi:hypothetical protein
MRSRCGAWGAFTADLYALAEWLPPCQIDTGVRESTGIYWIARFEVLEERGFDVKLVDPHSVRQVPGPRRTCRTINGCERYEKSGGNRCFENPDDK